MEPELSTQTTLRPAQILAFRLGVSYHPPDSPSLPGTLAFETIRGEAGVDFIGTDGVDALFALNEPGTKFIDAKAGNDNVDLFDESGVVGTAEVKLGEGNDTFTMGVNSTITNRLSNSTVNGGPGNDNIATEGAVSTKLRGNEDDDDFYLQSNYTSTTLNGNSGNDSFTIGFSDAARGGNITLSDSKILGGSDADGQMDFTDGAILGVDSVIQGGKGGDTIQIGDISAGSSGFRVTGGADNDSITVSNTINSDLSTSYNGADGRDIITFTGLNAADAVTKGGAGDDRFVISGSGEILALGEDGDDYFTIDAFTTADHTLNGAAGADVYEMFSGQAVIYQIPSVSDSAATLSGTSVGFDTFLTAIDNSTFGDMIDITGGAAEELVGNRLTVGDEVSGAFGTQAAVDVFSFDGLVNALDGALTPSVPEVGATNRGQISFDIVEVADTTGSATNIDGYYLVINNTNAILDSGDMMFQLASTTLVGATAEAGEIELAIEAAFAA